MWSSASLSSRWSIHSSIDLDAPITSFDLHSSGVAVIGTTSSLHLLTLQQIAHSNTWKQIWTKRAPGPIADVQWNDSASHFAAFVQGDRRVLVWQMPRRGGSSSAISPRRTGILVHPSSVRCIEWRGSPADPSSSSSSSSSLLSDDVLITRADDDDGAARIWSPVIDQPDQLRLSATVGTDDLSSSTPSSPCCYLSTSRFAAILRSAIALLERDLQMADLGVGMGPSASSSSSTDTARTRLKRLQHLLADTPDVFLRLCDDASTIIVRAVANIDRRPPTLLQTYTVLVLKLPRPIVSSSGGGSSSQDIDSVTLNPLPIKPGQSVHDAAALLHLTSRDGTAAMDVEISPALFFDGLADGVVSRSGEQGEGLRRGHGARIVSLHGADDGGVVAVDAGGESITWTVAVAHGGKSHKSTARKTVVPRTRQRLAGAHDAFVASDLLYHNGDVVIGKAGGASLLMTSRKQTSSAPTRFDVPSECGAVVVVLSVSGEGAVTAITARGHLMEWQPGASSPTSNVDLSASSIALACVVPDAGSGSLRFITFDTASSTITLWQRHEHTHKVEQVHTVKTDIGPTATVTHMQCSADESLALVTRDNNDGHTLRIYSLPASPFESALQYVHTSPASIVGLDWRNTAARGSPPPSSLLAVATEDTISVLARTRATPHLPGPLWTIPASFNAQAFGAKPLVGAKWAGGSGALVVAESGNVHLLSGDSMDLLNSERQSLPAYHPTVLRQAIAFGRFAVVERIVADLARALEDAALEERREVSAASVPSVTQVELQAESVTQRPTANGNGSVVRKHASLFDDDDDESGDSDKQETAKKGNAIDTAVVGRILKALETIQLEGLTDAEASHLTRLLSVLGATGEQSRTLDAPAYLYLVALRELYNGQRAPPSPPLDRRYTALAMHAGRQHHESLLDAVRSASPLPNQRVTWSVARASNLALFASQEHLRTWADIIARDTFHVGNKGGVARDPIPCSLFYYALGNRRVVLQLWRQAAWHPEQRKMITFLEKDFSEERWRTAACKNAFALLSQRRFEFAASFFLLGDSLQDAVNVCVKNLDDVQLAVAIARIKEARDDGPVLTRLLRERVLPNAIAQGDRYLAHWALWTLGERTRAAQILTAPMEDQDGVARLPAQLEDGSTLARVLYPCVVRRNDRQQRDWQFALHASRTLERIGCGVFGQVLLDEWRRQQQQLGEEDGKEAVKQGRQDTKPSSGQVDTNVSRDDKRKEPQKPNATESPSARQPTAAPPDPSLDDLLGMGGGGSSIKGASANVSPVATTKRQPTEAPPDPSLDDLLNMGGGGGGGNATFNKDRSPSSKTSSVRKEAPQQRRQPTQAPPDPSLDDLLNMGGGGSSGRSLKTANGNASSENGIATTANGNGNDSAKDVGVSTDQSKTADGAEEADGEGEPGKPSAPKGSGTLFKPSSQGASQGAQEFDMSSFGF